MKEKYIRVQMIYIMMKMMMKKKIFMMTMILKKMIFMILMIIIQKQFLYKVINIKIIKILIKIYKKSLNKYQRYQNNHNLIQEDLIFQDMIQTSVIKLLNSNHRNLLKFNKCQNNHKLIQEDLIQIQIKIRIK